MNILNGTLHLSAKNLVARDTYVMNFTVETETQVPFDFKPGQFVTMEFGPKAWRAYSIASHPSEAQLQLAVRLVEGGIASEVFRTAEIGQNFNFKGPFGHFGLSDNADAILNFCATGTGIAPYRPMIMAESQKPNPRPMRLFYGGRDAEDLAYISEIQNWCPGPDLDINLGLSRAENLIPNSKKQRITTYLEDLEIKPEDEFYLCGSGPMVKSVLEILQDRAVPKTKIFQERFN